MTELTPGMKCYAKLVSLHIDGHELIYNAPRGKKFALILMDAEQPDNYAGIHANDFIRAAGWRHETDSEHSQEVERD